MKMKLRERIIGFEEEHSSILPTVFVPCSYNYIT